MENVEINKKFWVGKKVFITGHTGFKGSWLTAWLKLLGASVTGYALSPPTTPSLFSVANVEEGMTSHIGNILDTSYLVDTIKQQRPEIIFHLAAQPLVHYSYQNPVETYSVNVIGTVNVLEAIRAIDSVRAVVIVTSDKCYENQEWVWGYRETDSMGGFDPYSSSKGCTELVAATYRRSYFNVAHYDQHRVALATVRAGNVIGGGDWSTDRLIPDLIRAFQKNETTIIRNPDSHRPWQYILDVLKGYILLSEKLYQQGTAFADAWNFGPNDDSVKSVGWIANKMADLWGKNAKWMIGNNPYPHEARCLKLDCNKSRTLLQWKPRMNIDELLKQTLTWYQAYYQKDDMKKMTDRQILEYA